jgi:hypothetical protein
MFRVIFAIRRRPELSRQQFADHWVQHAPLLQGLPNLSSYTQCLVTWSERLTGPRQTAFRSWASTPSRTTNASLSWDL